LLLIAYANWIGEPSKRCAVGVIRDSRNGRSDVRAGRRGWPAPRFGPNIQRRPVHMSVTKGWGVDWSNKRETTIDQENHNVFPYVFQRNKANNVVLSIDKRLKGVGEVSNIPAVSAHLCWWLIDFRSTVSRHFFRV
jgi:hypothetical protein